MIDAGILFLQPLDTGGFRWAVGNTTYGRDASFVFNRISVVEAAGFIAFDLRFMDYNLGKTAGKHQVESGLFFNPYLEQFGRWILTDKF